MHFSFVTLFPSLIDGYFKDSILGNATQEKKITISFHNPRDYTTDKHRKVDAPMVGGGAGMLMTPQPLFDTIKKIKERNSRTILLSPVGKRFNHNDAKRLSKYEQIILISGRYEGVDERIIECCVDEIFSVGDFILTGGELASLIVCDSVSRHIDGVLGNSNSLIGESFEMQLLEAPAFTKPDIFEKIPIISEYLKGNHSKITALKRVLSLHKTKYFRPDLYKKVGTKAKNEK